MPQQQLKVMISSTVRDLPEHRKEILDACARQETFPVMMEHLPALDADAIEASLAMVKNAEIYVGVFAHRYGHVPAGHDISITEMEYNQAVESNIPRFIFLMHEDHPVKAADVETGPGADKLGRFKEHVGAERVVNHFKSPSDLRAHVINTLSHYRTQHNKRDVTSFHYVSDIPTPPEPFIAHPYTLLQTPNLIGRQPELKLLTDWITGEELEADGRKVAGNSVRIMNIVAIGGLGKSALTWKWFNDIAPQEMKSLAGRMWWSFYESDATFENFVTRALAYVTNRPRDEVQEIAVAERESQLLATLDHQPYLLALDGLERVLIAYARMDSSRLDDRQIVKERNLRKTDDPRVGSFLKKLARVRRSRILISSRLYASELQTDGGDPIPGCFRCGITGLTDEDGVELWETFGVSGSREELLRVFTPIGNHPLLIQALAGEVKRFRHEPGDFAKWRAANPTFDPAKLSELSEAMGHVLEFALLGVDEKSHEVLHTIAAFRMPTGYDTLAALMVGENKACANEYELDAALTELEDRGLLGWDKRANRYDLHPIVRSVVWGSLGEESRRGVYKSLRAHFNELPAIDENQIESVKDLIPAIELYYSLIGLRYFEDAKRLFDDRLSFATFYRLNAYSQLVELLEWLFPDGLDRLPRLKGARDISQVLNALGLGYQFIGKPGRAITFFRRQLRIPSSMSQGQGKKRKRLGRKSHSRGYRNLSDALRRSGALCESEDAIRRALVRIRARNNRFSESISLSWFGLTLAARGVVEESGSALLRSLRIYVNKYDERFEGFVNSHLAQRALWTANFDDALGFAGRAWHIATSQNIEGDSILAARLEGEAHLGLNDLTAAEQRLQQALIRARIINYVEEGLSALVALAEMRRRQKDMKGARELLDDVWEPAGGGPYPLIHADAFNVLAQIERDEGNTAAAVEAATKAYRLAWCDGPPFAYHWGLEKAKKHLRELGASEPEMPPFDESKFEPMPEVEIDPDDEFHVGSASDVGLTGSPDK